MAVASLPAATAAFHVVVPGDAWPIAAVSGILGLVTLAVWIGIWGISGRIWPAYIALALLPTWVLAEASGRAAAGSDSWSLAAFALVFSAGACTALLIRARRLPEVDTSFRPFRAAGFVLAAIIVVVVGLVAVLPPTFEAPTFAVVLAGGFSSLLWCIAAGVSLRSRSLGLAGRRQMAVALLAFSLAAGDRTVGILRSADHAAGHAADHIASWAFACARVVSLAGWVLLFVVAVRIFVKARTAARGRQHELRAVCDTAVRGFADQQVRIQERRHDMRSLVAGIQSATATLARYRGFLGVAEERQLESALVAEITRLQHVLAAVPPVTGQFLLRAVLDPVIVAERARGTVVRAVLVDAYVQGDGDAIAALVQNLLANVHRHAPGAVATIASEVNEAGLRLVVSDDGAGLSPAAKTRAVALFADGSEAATRAVPPTPRTEGQGGLGLAICARLAREQHASIRFADTPAGTAIELVLRLATHQQAAERIGPRAETMALAVPGEVR